MNNVELAPQERGQCERRHAQALQQLGERVLPAEQRHFTPGVAVYIGKAAHPHPRYLSGSLRKAAPAKYLNLMPPVAQLSSNLPHERLNASPARGRCQVIE